MTTDLSNKQLINQIDNYKETLFRTVFFPQFFFLAICLLLYLLGFRFFTDFQYVVNLNSSDWLIGLAILLLFVVWRCYYYLNRIKIFQAKKELNKHNKNYKKTIVKSYILFFLFITIFEIIYIVFCQLNENIFDSIIFWIIFFLINLTITILIKYFIKTKYYIN